MNTRKLLLKDYLFSMKKIFYFLMAFIISQNVFAKAVTVSTLAGSGTAGAANGNGTLASFSFPAGVAVDASGNVYVADRSNNLIRKITVSAAPTLTLGSATNPTTCGGTNGSIALSSTGIAAGSQSLSYKKDAATVATTANVTVATDGSFTLMGLGKGVYSDFAIGSTIATSSRTLNDPAAPVITSARGNNPTVCATATGSIELVGTIAGRTYSVSYSKNGTPVAAANYTATSFQTTTPGSPIFLPGLPGSPPIITPGPPIITTTTIPATITGLTAGTYTNIIATLDGCASLAVSATLSDPAAPTFTVGSVSNITTTATTFSLPYSGVTGSPNQYSITTGTPNAMTGFTTISNASLTSSPLSVTIPVSAANTYNFVATVRNSTTGCVSTNSNFAVTVVEPPRPFITRWDLSKSAGSGATQISFGVQTSGSVSYIWQQVGGSGLSGSGTFTGTTATITGLPTGAIIDLSISPANFQRININNGTDRSRLTQLRQWGTVAWISMQTAFSGCGNFTLTATDVPNLAGVTDMSQMFLNCISFNQALPEGFNTATVTNMGSMFSGCRAYNQALPSSFNTAAVTDMSFMFSGCTAYNQTFPNSFNTAAVTNMNAMFADCSVYNKALPETFNTSAVTIMFRMFNGATAFDQNISAWNTSNVTNMSSMFNGATAFNQNIGTWNTGNVTNMSFMFNGATAFDQNIGTWNTGNVTNMSFMFGSASVFNQNIGTWNTGNVTNMSFMFVIASAFNQNIGDWNTSNVINMSSMFNDAQKFNQPLTNWNTAKVTNMSGMFSGAIAFNQDLSVLEINAVTNMTLMLNSSKISTANYDATLTEWLSQNRTGLTLGANGLTYCAARAARTTLVTPVASSGKGWTITGDKGCPTTSLVSSLNPSTSGSNVTFTATVSPNTVTGTVTFKDGTTTLETRNLSGGVATYSTSTLALGNRSITAVYNGDASNATSTSNVLNQVVTSCALTTSPGNVDITWTGFQNKEWNNACNWSPAWVPDVTNAKAIIPGSQEDQPIISVPVPAVNSIDINGGTLTISSSGTLNIRENGGVNKGIRLDGGTLTNNGNINIESSTNTAINAYIYLSSYYTDAPSTFTNNGTVKINSTDEAIGVGGASANAFITNNGIINVVNGIGVEVALASDVMTFVNEGIINYNGTALALSLQGNSSFTNSGTININSGTGISQTASVSLTNNGCGKIFMATGTYVNGGGTTTNRGVIQMPNNFDYTNTGTFTNNGIVKANSVTGINNSTIIVSNTCPIFTLGGIAGKVYAVLGIFTDAAATNSAGTYTAVGNVFTANNTLPTGLQTLYAQLEGDNCDELITIPFDFNNVKPTAVSISSTTVCEGASVNLLATCASGTPTWYATTTGGTALGTGTSFSYSPPVGTVNQSFYAACETTNCKSGRTTTSNSVTVNANQTAFASSNSPVCAGSTINLSSVNQRIVAVSSGAPAPQTYAWTGPNSFNSTSENPNIPSATILSSGIYQVTVTSFEGCTATATTSVTVNPSPILNPSSNSPVCSGETLFLTAKGNSFPSDNDTYVWAGVNGFTANTQNPNLGNVGMNANGVYTVTATNSANCSATATVTVTVKQTPTLVVSNFTNPTPENNPDGTISFTTNLPNGSFSLSYGSTGSPKDVSVASGAFILNGLVSGVYGNFAVTNDGCTGRNNTEVTLLSTPFTLVKSIATGNWEASTTWNVGRVPKAGDVVIVDASHAVTINGNSTIKDMEVRGTLIYGAIGIVINLGL